MRKMKKIVAIAAAMAMAMSSATVFAAGSANGNLNGEGGVEDVIEKDVFVAVLPTMPTTNTPFNFILDPQDLIQDTNAGAYVSGSSLTASDFTSTTGMYFPNTAAEVVSGDAAVTKYTENSDKISLQTKATTDCALKVEATVTLENAENVKFASSSSFSGKDTEIYLALTDGTDTVPFNASGQAVLEATMSALADTSFETKYENGKYVYDLTDAAKAADGSKYEFQLTGACNKNADWLKVKNLKADVKVVWTITKPGASSYPAFEYNASTSKYVFAPSTALTAADLRRVVIVKAADFTDFDSLSAKTGTEITASVNNGGKVVIDASVIPSAGNYMVKVVLTDGSYIGATLTK